MENEVISGSDAANVEAIFDAEELRIKREHEFWLDYLGFLVSLAP